MRSLAIAALCLALAACSGDKAGEASTAETSRGPAAEALDEQAIRSGLIPDPNNLSLSGQYETSSEMGTDKFCATKKENSYAIGVLAVFGPESKCEGQGSAAIEKGKLRIILKGEDKCSFLADYDGVALRFPGQVDEGCASYCTPRASFAGTSYHLVAEGSEAARKTLGRDIDKLCT